MRRCVICGSEQTEDENGNPNYHYPKTKKEARIWQRSLHAESITLEALQKYCCVCMEHIPELVDRSSTYNLDHRNYGDSVTDYKLSNKKPRTLPPQVLKPPVSVLLMTGASLPTYCGKACADNDYKDDLHGILSETDICVLESNFSDCGTSFPDVDEAEITVMRAPVQEEKERKGKALRKDKAKKTENCEGPDCTDVLLLAKSSNWDDECPCDGSNSPCVEKKPGPCCPPGCQPLSEPPPRFNDVPCGCECEQRARQELNDVIDQQAKRIQELENLLIQQNERQDQIIFKVDELQSELKKAPIEKIEPTQPIKTKKVKINTKRPSMSERDRLMAEYRERKGYVIKEVDEIPINVEPSKINDDEINNKSPPEIPNDTKAEQTTKMPAEKSQEDKKDEKSKPTFLKRIQHIMTRNPITKEKATRMHGLVVTRDKWDSN